MLSDIPFLKGKIGTYNHGKIWKNIDQKRSLMDGMIMYDF